MLAALPAGAGDGERRSLYVYTWYDYFDSEVINLFQQTYNCRVEMAYFISNEDMMATLTEAGNSFDLVTPSSYTASVMHNRGLLMPLDHSLLPGLNNLDRDSLPNSQDPDHVYSVPYTISVAGVLYDTRLVDGEDIGGWGIFANPRYAGRMTLINDTREVVAAALKHLGHSLNTTDEGDLREAGETLARWIRNGCAILDDDTALELDPATRVVSHAYSGDAALAISEDENAGFYLPSEGSSNTSDDFVVMAGAENPDLAHAFINFLLQPEIARRNMEGIFYYMPNKAALPHVSEELRENPAFNLSPELMKRCETIHELGEFNDKYQEVWDRVYGEKE